MQTPPRPVLLKMDWDSGTVELYRSDGKSAVFPIPSMPSRTEPLRRVWWAPDSAVALAETTGGQAIAVELPTADTTDRLAARKVIYLDQNHWSTLARSVSVPGDVHNGESKAAKQLIQRVESSQIVLPLSSGNLAETAKWTKDGERKQLAETMLRLSRGWQMRDPALVRRTELQSGLLGELRPIAQRQWVFTLEPNAIYGDALPMEPPPRELPEPWALATRSLLHLSVMVSVLLDDEATPMTVPHGWVDRIQRFTDWLASETDAAKLRRARTNAYFLFDAMKELARAAAEAHVSPERLSDWTRNQSDDAFSAMPAVGLYREALREKLLNPGTRWEANDLQDLWHLTVAAAYADAAVGDRSTIGTLNGAKHRHPCRAILCRTLAQLVERLDE